MTPITGFGVYYSHAGSPDLEGDYFTKETDLDLSGRVTLSCYWEHGFDQAIGKRRIGIAAIERKSAGLWVSVKPIPELPPAIWNSLVSLAGDGLLGFSSGAASHLVEKQVRGGAVHISRWPLIDLSLTVSPAEPRAIAAPGSEYVKRVELNARVTKLQSDYVQHLRAINDVRLWQFERAA